MENVSKFGVHSLKLSLWFFYINVRWKCPGHGISIYIRKGLFPWIFPRYQVLSSDKNMKTKRLNLENSLGQGFYYYMCIERLKSPLHGSNE